jgi:hypothetical protein
MATTSRSRLDGRRTTGCPFGHSRQRVPGTVAITVPRKRPAWFPRRLSATARPTRRWPGQGPGRARRGHRGRRPARTRGPLPRCVAFASARQSIQVLRVRAGHAVAATLRASPCLGPGIHRRHLFLTLPFSLPELQGQGRTVARSCRDGCAREPVSVSRRVGLAGLSVPRGRAGTRAACFQGGDASAAGARRRRPGWPPVATNRRGRELNLQMHPHSACKS